MEVVIHFTPNEEGDPPAASCGMLGGVLLRAKHMGDGIHAECHVPLDDETNDSGNDKCAERGPPKRSDERRKSENCQRGNNTVKFILPANHPVAFEICDAIVVWIGPANALGRRVGRVQDHLHRAAAGLRTDRSVELFLPDFS